LKPIFTPVPTKRLLILPVHGMNILDTSVAMESIHGNQTPLRR
jgi:hypothetical protein